MTDTMKIKLYLLLDSIDYHYDLYSGRIVLEDNTLIGRHSSSTLDHLRQDLLHFNLDKLEGPDFNKKTFKEQSEIIRDKYEVIDFLSEPIVSRFRK